MAEIRCLTRRERRSITTIEPKGRVTDFRIDVPETLRGQNGRYRLVAQIDDSKLDAVGRRFRKIVRRQIVNLKQPSSKEELADHYLQLAYQARVSGQPAEIRRWAAKVLELNPTSIAALSDIGMSLLREGNCAHGRPIMIEVIRLLSSGADPGLMIRDDAAREWKSNLEERVKVQCG